MYFTIRFFCSNTEQKHITENDDRAFAVAERKGDFKYSADEEKDNQYRFKGGQNEITMNRIYDEEWICDYHMGYICTFLVCTNFILFENCVIA